MQIEGNTALITGGARRVGRAIATTLAAAGARVILHYHHSQAEAEEAATEIRATGRGCDLICADLADAGALQRMLAALEMAYPPIDVLINSAAVFPRTPINTLTVEQWDQTLAVNLRAPFVLSRRLGLLMADRGSGKIINIADASVRRPYRDHLPYLVSKASLASLTEVLALELAPHVQVNTVAPGTVLLPPDSPPGLEQAIIRRTPLGRIGSPDDVAALVLFLIEHGDFMTGGTYAADGGVSLGKD
jgi:pteridine reductase